jgi:hypothetical protein
MRQTKHTSNGVHIDWTQLPVGTRLRKFIATDEPDTSGDYGVELHGLIDEGNGTIYIVEEIITYPDDTPQAGAEG